MDALIARGRIALAGYVDKAYPKNDPPIGSKTLAVVTREDFLAHPGVCLDFAIAKRSLYILEPSGAIVALLCRHTMKTGR